MDKWQQMIFAVAAAGILAGGTLLM